MRIWFFIFFLICLCITGFVNMPVKFFYDEFVSEKMTHVSVTNISGRFWQGHASIKNAPQLQAVKFNAPKIEWQLDFEALKEFKIHYDIKVNQLNVLGLNLGDFAISADYSDQAQATLQDVASPLKIHARLDHLREEKALILEGNIKLKEANPALESLLLLGAEVINPSGDFRLRFNTQ